MRTGHLLERTAVLTWKHYDGTARDKTYYAAPGAPVRWESRTNEGYEDAYGGRHLLWTEVWSEELSEWCTVGLEESEVDWND